MIEITEFKRIGHTFYHSAFIIENIAVGNEVSTFPFSGQVSFREAFLFSSLTNNSTSSGIMNRRSTSSDYFNYPQAGIKQYTEFVHLLASLHVRLRMRMCSYFIFFFCMYLRTVMVWWVLTSLGSKPINEWLNYWIFSTFWRAMVPF